MSGDNLQVELSSHVAIDETSLPNSVLTRPQANRFIDLVVNVSTLLRRVRVVRTNVAKGEVNKLDLGTIVTEGAASTSCPTTRAPSERTVRWDTEKYRSAFDLKTDFLEDNIEGAGVRDTLLNMFTKRIAMDTEIAAIEGDEDLPVGDGESDENNLLGVNYGWKRILEDNVPSGQIVDAAGGGSSDDLFYTMKRKIPVRFRTALGQYVWIASPGTSDKWVRSIQGRPTSAGDSALGGTFPGPWGIPILEVPLMPEDLTFGTAGTDGTQIWLTPLANLIYIVQRDITIEFDRRPRNDMWEVLEGQFNSYKNN